MTNSTLCVTGALLFIAIGSGACASKPAAPFDTLKTANVTAFRLQNYEPPPTAVAVPGTGLIPGIPNEIQSWIQQGAQGLQQLIPPGLLPPGLVPNGAQAPGAVATPTNPDTVPRFQGFRILSQTNVMDSDLKEDLAKLFGKEGNFDNSGHNCMYAEMGLTFTGAPGSMSNDMLISFSCNQVQAKTFPWPHPASGMKPGTVKELSTIVQKLWPAGT